jgi:hypothetical protein
MKTTPSTILLIEGWREKEIGERNVSRERVGGKDK